MMGRKIFTYAALLGLAIGQTLHAAEPQNYGLLKQQIKEYYNSGLKAQDAAKVGIRAMNMLKDNAKTPGKLALVLDIDETALSNWTHIESADLGFDQNSWDAWVHSAAAPAIPPALELATEAKKQDVAIFFITGRCEKLRKATEENLRNAGYPEWKELFMMPDDEKDKSESVFKARIRKKITNDGYTIIINMGDQQSDLDGGYAEHTFKLPNPCYFIK